MDNETLQLAIFLSLLLNVLMLIFIMLQVSRQSSLVKSLITEQAKENEQVQRIKDAQKILRRIHKSVFEGYTNARGQPRMSTEFLASYSAMQSEFESLVALIDDKQLTAFVEQGIMPEAPSATGDWLAQLGKKTKLVTHIHTRLYELTEEVALFGAT